MTDINNQQKTTAANEQAAVPVPVRPDSPTFAELGARQETTEALAAVGITHAFAIQEYALPIALRGTDLIGQAPTGTGKTLCFGIPLVDRVLTAAEGADGLPQALVIVPTRELCLQVTKDLAAAGRTRSVRVLQIYGGVAYEPQVEALRGGVEILVGTPGRLMDLAKQKKLRLDRVRALVLDEADRMLDLGFLDDVERILAMLPDDRQTMLFSATMPDPIVTLARRFLRHPVTIHAGHSAETGPSPLTKQVVYRTHPMNKIEVVARILQSEGRGLTMIFTRTKRAADRIAEDLDFRGFAAAAVHGDLGQGARERALRAFRSGKIDVLVATDVAARGLDVSGVTHVINYDCPEDQDTYTHRIGRTGRAGATGVAVTFVDWEDMPRWRIIDKTLGLEMPEPPETYHTSPFLYTDLGIPTDVTGTLPTADRTRAGLNAEVEEDLGGRSFGRRRGQSRSDEPARPRPRTRRRARAAEPGERTPAPAPAAQRQDGEEADAAASARPRRQRRRRRAGEMISEGAVTDAVGGATWPEAELRGGDTASTTGPAVSEPASETGATGDAAAGPRAVGLFQAAQPTTTAPRRRRRTRGSGADKAEIPAVTFAAPPEDGSDAPASARAATGGEQVSDGEHTSTNRPRRRRRRTGGDGSGANALTE